MLRYLPALLLALGAPVLIGPAWSQDTLPHAPIVCTKDSAGETACLQKLRGHFTRTANTLTLKLDGGKSKTYVDNAAACDGENVEASKCLVYTLRGYFPRTQSYLVEKALYECGNYLFVSRRTGSETPMQEVPVLSPSAKYLLSIDQSDACEREHDIAIWSLLTDPPTLDFKYKAERYENWEVKAWTNDAHISMKAWINDKTSYDQEAELVRGQRGWTLNFGKKSDHR